MSDDRRPRSFPSKSLPLGLKLLIAYKTVQATGLLIGAIALAVSGFHHARISQYALSSHRLVVVWVLEHLTQVPPRTLEFAAVAATLYALLAALEAIGLWFRFPWARWLVLIGVGISLPVEVMELFHAVTPLKLMLLVANAIAFWYVLKRVPNHV